MVPAGQSPGLDDFPNVTSLEQLDRRLRSAWLVSLLTERRLTSHFQPIFAPADRERPVAYEALARGMDIDGALISGGRLVQAADDAGLRFQFDLAARLSAVERFVGLGVGAKLFVSFSPTAIYDPAFCLRTTIARIKKLGLQPEQVVFESVESERQVTVDHRRAILAHYRRMGFQVALDDFGSGYNNLDILEQLRPDLVKIDMGLSRNIDSSGFKSTIVADLIALCRRFSIRTLGEGVETEAELAWLIKAGVDLVQGYLLGRPDPGPRPG